MAERLLSKSRLERARAIPDHAIVEFAKVQDEPLVVYGLIQGSDREPYTVLIDLEEKIVAHWCPDFEGGYAGSYGGGYRGYGGGYGGGNGGGYSHGWCKHLGKILLMLVEADANKIVPVASSLTKIISKSEIKGKLEKVKEKRVSAIPPGSADQPEISIVDQISVACQQTADGKECSALLEVINKRIEVDYSQMDASLILFGLNNLLGNVPEKFKKIFVSRTKVTIDRLLTVAVERFFSTFWITSAIKRLESAAILRTIAGCGVAVVIREPRSAGDDGASGQRARPPAAGREPVAGRAWQGQEQSRCGLPGGHHLGPGT